jgi:hypothetical protein
MSVTRAHIESLYAAYLDRYIEYKVNTPWLHAISSSFYYFKDGNDYEAVNMLLHIKSWSGHCNKHITNKELNDLITCIKHAAKPKTMWGNIVNCVSDYFNKN